jgi:hypothetical protein
MFITFPALPIAPSSPSRPRVRLLAGFPSNSGRSVQIISGDQGGIVRLWTISSWSCERILEGHSGPIRGVAFCGGRAMVSCSQDETVRVWDLATGAVRAKLVGHDCDVRAVAAAVDGRVAVSCGFDGIIRIWDLHAAKQTGSIATGHTDKVAIFSKFSCCCGAYLFRGERPFLSPYGLLPRFVLLAVTFCLLRSLPRPSLSRRFQARRRARSQARVPRAQLTQRSPPPNPQVFSIAISADGSRAASASWDTSIRIWDLRSAQEGPSLILMPPSGTGEGRLEGRADPSGRLVAPSSLVGQRAAVEVKRAVRAQIEQEPDPPPPATAEPSIPEAGPEPARAGADESGSQGAAADGAGGGQVRSSPAVCGERRPLRVTLLGSESRLFDPLDARESERAMIPECWTVGTAPMRAPVPRRGRSPPAPL